VVRNLQISAQTSEVIWQAQTLCKEIPIMTKQSLATVVGFALALGMIAGKELLTPAGAAQVVAVEPGWRYSDGYWNYWDADDRAWYYTDGRNWYTYNNNAWGVYTFDKSFGKKYYREGYVVPTPGPTFVVPNHQIKVKVK
jgi:hypothetical protein